MPLPPRVQAVYGRFWALAQGFASAVDSAGKYLFGSPDLISAAAELNREAGQALSFAEASGLPGLFAAARSIDRAASALNSAGPGTAIDASMVAEWPTAASLATQAAQPMYMAKAQVSYVDVLGQQQTRWITLSGITQLPATNDLLALRMQGAAITAFTAPVSEGGTPKASGEVMAEFGDVLQMQLFTV